MTELPLAEVIVAAGEGDGTAESPLAVTNQLEKLPFEFSKKWRNIGGISFDEWADGKEIEVTIQRRTKTGKTLDPGFELVYTISCAEGKVAATLKSSKPEKLDAEVYKLKLVSDVGQTYLFKLGEVLDKYTASADEYEYFAKETKNAAGYSQVSYVMADGNAKVSGDDTDKALSGETIINIPDNGVELPSTGGPGTRLHTILGSILILGAGILLWRRRRLI